MYEQATQFHKLDLRRVYVVKQYIAVPLHLPLYSTDSHIGRSSNLLHNN